MIRTTIGLTTAITLFVLAHLAYAGGPGGNRSGLQGFKTPGSSMKSSGNFQNYGNSNFSRQGNFNPSIKKFETPGNGIRPIQINPGKFPTKPLPISGNNHSGIRNPGIKIGDIVKPAQGPAPIITLPGKGSFPSKQIGNGMFPVKGTQQHHQDFKSWCHTHHHHSHWWFNYGSLHQHRPVTCNWHYCSPTVIVDGIPVVSNIRWYFGLQGLVLPGKGIGVESVEPGSPAQLANLQPGNVLIAANGISLIDAEALNLAIIRSNGLLQIDVLAGEGTPVQTVTIRLQAVQTASF